MKKCMAVFAAFVLAISFSAACGGKCGRHDTEKEIYKRYTDIKEFYAEADITVENPRGKNTYRVRQSYSAPDEYTLAVDAPETFAGSGYIFRGESAVLKSGMGKEETVDITEPDVKNCFFVSDFFAAYYGDPNSEANVSGGAASGRTTLECFIPCGEYGRARQVLTVDSETCLPLKLVTYGINDKARVTVEFIEFSLNSGTGGIEF